MLNTLNDQRNPNTVHKIREGLRLTRDTARGDRYAGTQGAGGRAGCDNPTKSRPAPDRESAVNESQQVTPYGYNSTISYQRGPTRGLTTTGGASRVRQIKAEEEAPSQARIDLY